MVSVSLAESKKPRPRFDRSSGAVEAISRAQPAGAPVAVPFARERAVAAVIVGALFLRMLWAALVPITPATSDPHAYDMLALNLATHGEYGWRLGERSSHWPPGTSFLFSLVFRVFGHAYWPIAILHALLGAAIVALGMALARRWFGARAAVIAGALLALWPSGILYTTILCSEMAFTVLLLSALCVHERPPGDGAPSAVRRGLAVGALLGLATYVRVEALLVPVALALGAILARDRARWRAGAAAVACLTAALVVAPWSARNTALHGRFAFVSTSVGVDLWMGNNPDSTGDYQELPEIPGLGYIEREHYLRGEAFRWIAEHPAQFVLRSLWKAVRFHDSDTMGVHWNQEALEPWGSRAIVVLKWVSELYWLAVLAGAVLGAFLLLRARGIGALGHPAIAVWAYITAVHAVSLALQDRFHFPLHALLAALAAYALTRNRARREA
jgi:4-amino-4-deoxy-L-arabinose transferase-like glycosyltransferase